MAKNYAVRCLEKSIMSMSMTKALLQDKKLT